MDLKYIAAYSSLLLPQLTWAFFCPNNFKQIDFGQTPEQVIAQCGKPDKKTETTEQSEGAQEWSYFIPQRVSNNTFQPQQGTLRTQVTFDSQNKAVSISVNGLGVGASTICGGQIQLGDSRETVKNACGEPSFVNKQNANPNTLGATPPPKKVVQFIYNSNPPVTIIFVNGKLESRQ